MSEPYEEIIEEEVFLRKAPAPRHELILERLHARVAQSLAGVTTIRLLSPRSLIELPRGNQVRPDLALVTVAGNKLFLAAEVVNSGDHSTDTVAKKTLYEEAAVPRLWMVDPRYDNVEIYHGAPHGLILKEILAVKQILTESVLPAFQYSIVELFQA
jgi:Uma2 family endonuclease